MLNWQIPRDVKEVRGFLGLCGTVRIWIENYSLHARPLTELTRTAEEFVWNQARNRAFENLKQKITSAPALRAIDYRSEKPVLLSVDTSYIAVGMVLSQADDRGKKRPARYGSLPMNTTEAKYSQPKLELYGLFRALRHWRLYIIGASKLQVEMDAKYIKGMLNEPDLQPSAVVNRWIQGILMFDFELVHVPATRFKGPDGLSRRRPSPAEIDEDDRDEADEWLDNIALICLIPRRDRLICMRHEVHHLLDGTVGKMNEAELQRQATKDEEIRKVYDYLSSPESAGLQMKGQFSSQQSRKRFIRLTLQFFVKEGVLYRRHKESGAQRVVMDQSTRPSVLEWAHDRLGHKGVHAVYELMRQRYYWPRMQKDTHDYIASCHECQIRNLIKVQIPPTIATPVRFMEKMYLDVMFMPPSGGYIAIVVARDDLSGLAEARPLRRANAIAIANFLEEEIYYRYGVVGSVVTDNGPEVQGAFKILARRIGIPHITITPYNKHGNGVVERGHLTLREAIIRSCEKHPVTGAPLNWHTKVRLGVFADKVTINSATGYSPYFIAHGVEPILPLDLVDMTCGPELYSQKLTKAELLVQRIRQLECLETDKQRAAEAVYKSRLRNKEQFHKRYWHCLQRTCYEPGELVLVRDVQFEATYRIERKTSPRYLGPYQIVRRTTKGNYYLAEMDGSEWTQPIAGFRIIPYITRRQGLIRMLEEAEHESETENVRPMDESERSEGEGSEGRDENG